MKFLPEYTITNNILQNVKEVYVLVSELNRKQIPNPIYSEMLYQSKTKSILHLMSLKGEEISIKEINDVLDKNEVQNNSHNIILNYNKAFLELNKNKKKNFDLNLLYSTHRSLYNKILSENELGKLRTENGVLKNQKGDKVTYSPPGKKDLPDLMKNLIAFINSEKEETDPLLLAGIYYRNLLLIRPFESGNIPTAEITTRILLSKINLNFFNLLNFTNYYQKDLETYFTQVGAIGNYYAIKDNIDHTKWLEYFTKGILEEISQLNRDIKKQKAKAEFKLLKDQEKIISYLKKYGTINDSEYSKITERKKATRVVDFNKLISLGLIERKGKARQTYYTLKKE